MKPMRVAFVVMALLCLSFGLYLIACSGEVAVTFPGCEECPERCLRSGNSGKCVDCIKDEQCQSDTSPTKKCLENRCYCGTEKDCPGGKICDGTKGCVECKENSHCKTAEKTICLERTCVACNPGDSRACSPEGLQVCVKGTQTCKGSGSWGVCENAVACQTGERCINSKCLPSCPDPAVCQKDEKQCTTSSDVFPGKYKECKRNDVQCYEFATDEKFCEKGEVCDKGACVPFRCPKAACTEGETRCVDDNTQQTCGRDKDNCVVWLPSKSCDADKKCRKSTKQCTLCEPKTLRDCYDGDAKNKNIGECKTGKQACSEDGSGWGSCEQQVLPKTDLCNGKDDDCDGSVDEDFAKLDKECVVGKGLCENKGKYVCTSDGKDVECNVKPKNTNTELCNGKDDNCNGQIDELFPDINKKCEAGEGICKAEGKYICKTDGSGVVCDAKTGIPGVETCNGKDDNCDGSIDEKLTRQCYTGTSGCTKITGTEFYKCNGICSFGVQNCTGGQWTVCVNEVKPQTQETCNGKDDNCDGSVDEGNPGGGGGCLITGKYAECAKGIQECQNGALGCKQVNLPKTELCNNKDDDCDGQIDNNVPTQTYYPDDDKDNYGNSAAKGVVTCAALAPAGWVTNNKDCDDTKKAINPKAIEICDNVDNNCNKQVDEGLPTQTYYPDDDKDNYGNSAAKGVVTCAALAPAGWVTNNKDCDDTKNAINPKATEICDGIDNNCDKQVDEGQTVKSWYLDSDKDSYGDQTVIFKGCDKDSTTVCTGLRACRSNAGYVTNNKDCCDKDDRAKPGQTHYFGDANKCGNFDYDCDGKSTPQYTPCSCSKTTKYSREGKTETYREGEGWQDWYVRSSVTSTYNASSCEMDVTISLQASSNTTRSCHDKWCCKKVASVCTKHCECNVTRTFLYTNTLRSWTPRCSSNKCIMWERSKYSKNCAYRLDGTTASCGDTVQRAGDWVDFTNHTISASGIQSGKMVCDGHCNKDAEARLNYTFVLDKNTYGYTAPSTSLKLPCR